MDLGKNGDGRNGTSRITRAARDKHQLIGFAECSSCYVLPLYPINVSTSNSCTSSSQEAVQAMLRKYIEEIRTGRREGSIISTDSIDSLSPDEKEAWRGVRKELEDVGITPELFTRHSAWIKKTLSDASQSGSLQEQPLAAQQFAVQGK